MKTLSSELIFSFIITAFGIVFITLFFFVSEKRMLLLFGFGFMLLAGFGLLLFSAIKMWMHHMHRLMTSSDLNESSDHKDS